MSNGIIVDHKESHVRFAISESNFNPEVHKHVRDLKPGETILGYKPRPIERLGEAEAKADAKLQELGAADAKTTEGSSQGSKAAK